MVHIRETTEADIADVVALRVLGWQTAYAGIVPQPYLDALAIEGDARLRRERFASQRGGVDLVAVDDGAEIVGWASFGPYRGLLRTPEPVPNTGELYALYIRPGLLGAGVGRALLDSVHAHSTHGRFSAFVLWVFRDNLRARRFYEKAGYESEGVEERHTYGEAPDRVPELRYRRRR